MDLPLEAIEKRPTSGPDDRLIVRARQARNGDSVAFGEIVETLWDPLVRMARSVLAAHHDDAEDVVQDSLVVAWNKIGNLRRAEAVQSWLTQIVVRRCFRQLKRPRPQELPELSTTPTPEPLLDIESLLQRLSPRQRAVIHLGALYGFDDKEIGDLLGMMPTTVRVHRLRGRRKLKTMLGEQP